MTGVLIFFIAWFLVSIPASLLIGAFLARRSAPKPATAFATYISATESIEVTTI